MTDRVLVPQATRPFKVSDPEPLTWQMLDDGGVYLTDPAGHFVRLNGTPGHPRWEVAADGAVSPSIHCGAQYAGCGWHVFVTLDGYPPS